MPIRLQYNDDFDIGIVMVKQKNAKKVDQQQSSIFGKWTRRRGVFMPNYVKNEKAMQASL